MKAGHPALRKYGRQRQRYMLARTFHEPNDDVASISSYEALSALRRAGRTRLT